MVGPGESLDTVARELSRAGIVPQVRDVDDRQYGRRPGVWVPMRGDGAYAVVVLADLTLGDRAGQWRPAAKPGPATAVGYQVSFHERPFRTRGHDYATPAEYRYAMFVDDVVATVTDWCRWEQTWSVTPHVESGRAQIGRLRRLAASKLNSPAIPVGIEIDPLMLALLDTEQATALHATVQELYLPGIRWRFPRDRTGANLVTRIQVLLAEFAPPARRDGKGVWLVVDGPLPRAEQRLTVRLARLDGRVAWHRWDGAPEYWRTGTATLDQLWGITGQVTAAQVEDVVAALLAGRTLEALATCGVTVDRDTQRLLSGLPTRFELREWTDKWVTAATAAVVSAAPWRWSAAVKPKQRPKRLVNLGGFNPSRRPGLFLEHRDGPHLTFDASASPLILPQVAWQRDIDQDLVRLDLINKDQVPLPPQGGSITPMAIS